MWLVLFCLIWNKNKKKWNTLKFSRGDAQKPFFSPSNLSCYSVSQSVLYAIFVSVTYVYFYVWCIFSYSYFFFFFFIFLRLSMTCTIDCECKNSLSYRCTVAHTYTCIPAYKYMLIHTCSCSSISYEYLPYYRSTLQCADGK